MLYALVFRGGGVAGDLSFAALCGAVIAIAGFGSTAGAQGAASDSPSIETLRTIFDSVENASESVEFKFLEWSTENFRVPEGYPEREVQRWYFGDGWYVSWLLHAESWPQVAVDGVPESLVRAHFYNSEYAGGVEYETSGGKQGDASLAFVASAGVGGRYEGVARSTRHWHPLWRQLSSARAWLPAVLRSARLESVEPLEVDGAKAYRWTVVGSGIDREGMPFGNSPLTYTLVVSADAPYRIYERTKLVEGWSGPGQHDVYSDWQVDGDVAFPLRSEHYFINAGTHKQVTSIRYSLSATAVGAALDERHARLSFYGLPEPDAPPSDWARFVLIAGGGVLLLAIGTYLHKRHHLRKGHQ